MPADVDVGEPVLSWTHGAPVHVVCVGNELARDDGVGIRVGRVLRALPLPTRILVTLYQELGFGLVELLASGEPVIIVDAIAEGRSPGLCRVIDAAELSCSTRGTMACHAFGISEMLDIARELSESGQLAWVRLVGVEVVDVTGFGTALTAPVALALPDAVERVLALLGAPRELVQAARELASRAPAELPLAELHAG